MGQQMEQAQKVDQVGTGEYAELLSVLDGCREANQCTPRATRPKFTSAITLLEKSAKFIKREREIVTRQIAALDRVEGPEVRRATEQAMLAVPLAQRDAAILDGHRARKTAIAQTEADRREKEGAKLAEDALAAMNEIVQTISKLKREAALPSSMQRRTPDLATLMHQNQMRADVAEMVRINVRQFAELYMSFRDADPKRARELREYGRGPLADLARPNERPGARRPPQVDIQGAADAQLLLRTFDADDRADRPIDLLVAEELYAVLVRVFTRLHGNDPDLRHGGMTDAQARKYMANPDSYRLDAPLTIVPGWLARFVPALRERPASFAVPVAALSGLIEAAERAEKELG